MRTGVGSVTIHDVFDGGSYERRYSVTGIDGTWHTPYQVGDHFIQERLVTPSNTGQWGSTVQLVPIKDLDYTNGDTAISVYEVYEYSIDGVTNWHTDYLDADIYRRTGVMIGGILSEWSVASKITGLDGVQSATVRLYILSATLPAVPAGNVIYTFANGSVTNAGSWTTAIPTNTVAGGKVWSTHNTALGLASDTTDILASADWSIPQAIIVNGYNGTNGTAGKHGNGSFIITLVNSSYIPANNSGVPSKDNDILLLAGRAAQAGDILTYQSTTSGSEFSSQYLRGASVWTQFTSVINGNQIINGTLAAEKIIAGSITSDHISAGSITGDRINSDSILTGHIQAKSLTFLTTIPASIANTSANTYTDTAKASAISTAASDATTKANNAKASAEAYALAKANLVEITTKAYADGVVDAEEARAIADATAKANAAQAAAVAQSFNQTNMLTDPAFQKASDPVTGNLLTFPTRWGDLTGISSYSVPSTDSWGLDYNGHTGALVQGVPQGNPDLYYIIASSTYPAEAGQTICGSIYTGAHRCRSLLIMQFMGNGGNVVGTAYSPSNENEASGGGLLSGYKRLFAIAVAPTGTVGVRILVVKYDTHPGETSSYLFYVKPQLSQVSAGTSVPPTWVAGSIGSDKVLASLNANYPSENNIQIKSANYVSGPDGAGWAIDSAGNAEFNNGTFRGIVSAGALDADIVTATTKKNPPITINVPNTGEYSYATLFSGNVASTVLLGSRNLTLAPLQGYLRLKGISGRLEITVCIEYSTTGGAYWYTDGTEDLRLWVESGESMISPVTIPSISIKTFSAAYPYMFRLRVYCVSKTGSSTGILYVGSRHNQITLFFEDRSLT